MAVVAIEPWTKAVQTFSQVKMSESLLEVDGAVRSRLGDPEGQVDGFTLLVPWWKEGGRTKCRDCGNNKLVHRRQP